MRFLLIKLFSTLPLAVALTVPAAASGPINLTYDGAGSATEIDINDDGVTGILARGSGKGSLGKVSIHAIFDAAPVANTRCAAGETQNDLVAATNVIQNKRGHQLFLGLVDGVLCADPTFTTFTLTIDEAILGGTGRYAGASGSTHTVCGGVFLALDFVAAGGRAAHSAFSCAVTGDLD